MLFVSCQPYKNEKYFTPAFILNLAYAAELGGAKGLRIEGVEHINYLKKYINLPIIGLIKRSIKNKERHICPELIDIDEILKTNCEYIAIDFTFRDNLDKGYYEKITEHIRKKNKCEIIADISNLAEARIAFNLNVDYISSTLRGYTSYTKSVKLPDIKFINQLKSIGINNIIAEGGYSSNLEYNKALESGAKIVVIGTAITRPHLIIKKILTGRLL